MASNSDESIGKRLSWAIGLGLAVYGVSARVYVRSWSPSVQGWSHSVRGWSPDVQGWSPSVPSSSPSDADIAKLEADIKLDTLPGWDAGLPSLSGYARYYTGSSMNGEQVIFGELVTPEGSIDKPGVHIVGSKQFPVIWDGGCAVINLVYSLKQQKLVSIRCNGVA